MALQAPAVNASSIARFQFVRIDPADVASLQKLEVRIGCPGISIISSAGTGPMDLDIAVNDDAIGIRGDKRHRGFVCHDSQLS